MLNHLLTNGLDATIELVRQWQYELTVLYAMTGTLQTSKLKKIPLLLSGNPKNWCDARNIDSKKYSLR